MWRGLTFELTGRPQTAKPAVDGPVERRVGRSRYAEKSRTGAARINLHEHSDGNNGVILQVL